MTRVSYTQTHTQKNIWNQILATKLSKRCHFCKEKMSKWKRICSGSLLPGGQAGITRNLCQYCHLVLPWIWHTHQHTHTHNANLEERKKETERAPTLALVQSKSAVCQQISAHKQASERASARVLVALGLRTWCRSLQHCKSRVFACLIKWDRARVWLGDQCVREKRWEQEREGWAADRKKHLKC